MDTPLVAPVGAPETKVGPADTKHTDLVTATCKESEQDCGDQQVVQRAEDNPRPAVPTAIGDASLGAPPVPLRPINAIPPTFSQSARVRRNARIRAVRQRIPAPILCRLKTLYWIPFFMWIIVTTVIFVVAPSVLAMVIGNSICKAVNRAYFPRTITAFSIGAAGSWFAALFTYPLGYPFGIFLGWLDNRARGWHIRSGRIPANSTRSDGHFPGVLLWILFLYLPCIFASVMGTVYVPLPDGKLLNQADVNLMCAIGATIANPIFVLFVSVYLVVSAMVHTFMQEVIQGFPAKDEGAFAVGYAYRQMEALVWLLSPRKTPTRTDIP